MVKPHPKARPFRTLLMALMALAIGLMSMIYGARHMAASFAEVMVPVDHSPRMP